MVPMLPLGLTFKLVTTLRLDDSLTFIPSHCADKVKMRLASNVVVVRGWFAAVPSKPEDDP